VSRDNARNGPKITVSIDGVETTRRIDDVSVVVKLPGGREVQFSFDEDGICRQVLEAQEAKPRLQKWEDYGAFFVPLEERELAAVSWCPADVTDLTEGMSTEEGLEFLTRNASRIQEAMLDRGFEVVEQLLVADGRSLKDEK
jgi:hypothetical protein